MIEWLIKSSNWILHLFDSPYVKVYAICGSFIVALLYLLYLVIGEGALVIRDNEDGTQTEWYCFGKRVVKKEEK